MLPAPAILVSHVRSSALAVSQLHVLLSAIRMCCQQSRCGLALPLCSCPCKSCCGDERRCITPGAESPPVGAGSYLVIGQPFQRGRGTTQDTSCCAHNAPGTGVLLCARCHWAACAAVIQLRVLSAEWVWAGTASLVLSPARAASVQLSAAASSQALKALPSVQGTSCRSHDAIGRVCTLCMLSFSYMCCDHLAACAVSSSRCGLALPC